MQEKQLTSGWWNWVKSENKNGNEICIAIFIFLVREKDFYLSVLNPFFNSSTSTFLITGLALRFLIEITLAFCDCLFLFSFLFKVVTAISILFIVQIMSGKGKDNFK